MNYKVLKYKCGCKYILITDPERVIYHRPGHSKCPVHWTCQDYVLLWCVDCGVKIKAQPNAGYRQERCPSCKVERNRMRNRKAWKEKYKGRYYKSGRIRYHTEETEAEKAERIITDCINGCQRLLPILA